MGMQQVVRWLVGVGLGLGMSSAVALADVAPDGGSCRCAAAAGGDAVLGTAWTLAVVAVAVVAMRTGGTAARR